MSFNFKQTQDLHKLYNNNTAIYMQRFVIRLHGQDLGAIHSDIDSYYNNFISSANSNDKLPYTLTFLLTYTKRSQVQEHKQIITDYMTAGYPRFTLEATLSTALSSRTGVTLVYRDNTRNRHIVFTTDESEDQAYRIYLSTMLLELKDNKDLVLRLTDAIVNTTSLLLTPEELHAIAEAHKIENINNYISTLQSLTSTIGIEHLKLDLEQKMDELITRLASLRERYQDTLKTYALEQMFKQDDIDSELRDYLMSTDNITEVTSRDTTDSIVISNTSYVRLEDATDYLKGDPVTNRRHKLYQQPELYQMLKDIVDNKFRFKIFASYRAKNLSSSIRITGIQRVADVSYKPIYNRHITQHNCFAGYEAMMGQAIQDKDIVGLLEIMNQCTASINVYDGTVMNQFLNDLGLLEYYYPAEYKEDNEWKVTTIGEYYEKIKTNINRTTGDSTEDHTESPIF